MTLTIVPKDAEKLLTWPGLLDAFEAGHRLPKPDIKDLFVYRGPDTVLDRATWIDGLGALVKVATVIPGNAQRGLPTVNGSVTLYDDKTGELTALVDFHLVTKWKTAGDSLLSARRLALMQPSAYVVNTARGDIIDEDALIKMLQDGRLAGAGHRQ